MSLTHASENASSVDPFLKLTTCVSSLAHFASRFEFALVYGLWVAFSCDLVPRNVLSTISQLSCKKTVTGPVRLCLPVLSGAAGLNFEIFDGGWVLFENFSRTRIKHVCQAGFTTPGRHLELPNGRCVTPSTVTQAKLQLHDDASNH